ncbi:DUF397 domain-containing protein [Streptomyces sp. AC512_CC834]|uniref:DUF397 domain-containing protein n=1 Tax=Streptomyces sp. AC512_CC834 TaxID=2823691 RepID=UPI001C277DEF|nr:DUF397 domain-containing protein [Streptomyces sp. AC512_CC834]
MPEPTWQKSTYSAEAANCVEIARTSDAILVRDSKNPTSPRLTLLPATWAYFASHTASGPSPTRDPLQEE